jgi:hypothetical protein
MDATRKRLLFYLLLNGIVSACVTGSVLFIYDRYHTSASQPPAARVGSLATQLVSEGAAAPTVAATSVEISTVVGAGIPASETVILHNGTTAQVDLKGWKLQDQDVNVYTFGGVSLAPGGSVQLHTEAGQDTLTDLYWGLNTSIWQAGEAATLYDPGGAVRFVYQVP